MTTHDFIFNPGNWIGEGKITFSISPERLRFYTKWTFEEINNGLIQAKQQVEIEGGVESAFNLFTFSNILPNSFQLALSNELLSAIKGKGVIDKKTIAWEFRDPEFEGFEVYELQEDGDYLVHAEYTSTDEFRTIINGRVWKKT